MGTTDDPPEIDNPKQGFSTGRRGTRLDAFERTLKPGAELTKYNQVGPVACALLVRDVRRALNRTLIYGLIVFPLVAATDAAPDRSALSDPSPASNLTIVLNFKGPHSDRAAREMQREAETILKTSGLHLDWRMPSQAPTESYADVVVVTLSGICDIDSAPYSTGKRGSLGQTFLSDASMLPFSEIGCDNVAASVRSAMSGSDFEFADVLLGRALGRVLVHELVHVLTGSREHGSDGVHQAALSGQQLIAAWLPLSATDITRLKQRKNRVR